MQKPFHVDYFGIQLIWYDLSEEEIASFTHPHVFQNDSLFLLNTIDDIVWSIHNEINGFQ